MHRVGIIITGKKRVLTLIDNVEDGVRCNENEHRQRRLWGLRHSYIFFSFFLLLAIQRCWVRGVREGRMLLGINLKEEEGQGEAKEEIKEAVSSPGVFVSSVACFSLWRSRKKCVFTVEERKKG